MLTLALLLALLLETRMQMSDAGRSFLMLHEGVRLTAYRDAVGVLTIGAGHTSAAGPPFVFPGMTITSQEASEILAQDLRRFEREVLAATVGISLHQHEFDALVSLCYNIGPTKFQKSSVLRYLLARKKRDAAGAFSLWNKAKGRVLAGLTRRRREEARLFLTGHYTGVRLSDGRR